MTAPTERGVLAAQSVLDQIEDEIGYGSPAYRVVSDLIAFAESALGYVDEAAKSERERHRINGYPNSQVLAQTVADGLRRAISRARAGGES